MNSQKRLRVMLVVGTRPNFMKVAPLIREISKYPQKFNWFLTHTGQHYDEGMSEAFFDDLGLPKPDIYLGVGSGTDAKQTGKIMVEFERICLKEKPDLVVVVGDVNSTVACAFVAAKLCISVAHVEAGLRSFDRTMPEEINRIITDQLSEYLFTTCDDANQNLIKEGIPKNKIFFVGNTMIDCLLSHIKTVRDSIALEKLGLRKDGRIRKYGLITLHRPSNVDDPETLKGILNMLNELAKEIPMIFPIHPRTAKQMKNHELTDVMTMPPLGYLDFLFLMSNAAIVLTDSGGIQEETTILGVPCLTLRNNTERPITVKEGTNILVGNNPDKIMSVAVNVLRNGIPGKKKPKYWDRKVAERIIKILGP